MNANLIGAKSTLKTKQQNLVKKENFEKISHIVLVFLVLFLNEEMIAGFLQNRCSRLL